MNYKTITPDLVFESLAQVDIETLKNRGIRCAFLDLDNTVACWKSRYVRFEARKWAQAAKEAGINLYIVTNSTKPRADEVAARLGAGCFKDVRKPGTRRLRIIMRQVGTDASHCVMIGDQLFTDVLAARRLGMLSVLVSPLSRKEWWATKVFNRTRERLVWKKVFPMDKRTR